MQCAEFEQRVERYRALQDAFVRREDSLSPVVVEVEPTTACNLDCIFCPRSSLTRRHGRLSEDDLGLILENLGAPSDKGMLLFSGFGEPTRHEEIALFVRRAKKAGWFCGMTTNGTGMSESAAESLLSAGLDVLQVSLHAITDLTYRRIVNRGSYHEVVSRIRRILPMCSNRIVLALNFTVNPWNWQEIRSFASYWKERGISHINFSPCHNRGGHFQGLPHARSLRPHARGHAGCWTFRNALYVTWDGRLLACCNDLSGETNRGDLRQRSLPEIRGGEEGMDPAYEMCCRCDFPFK